MIQQFTINFLSDYLLINALLFPILLIYLFAQYFNVRLEVRLQFHKILVVSFLILPIVVSALTLATYPISTDLSANKFVPEEIDAANRSADHSSTLDAKRQSTDPNVRLPFTFYASAILPLLSTIVSIGIGLGFSIFIFKYVFSLFRFRIYFTHARIQSLNNNTDVLISNQIQSAFSVGFFRKNIFIPDTLTDNERFIIIKHELNHFNCHHHWWLMFETLLTHLFWFNPISHYLRNQGRVLYELECDNKTVEEVDKFEYGRTLVNMAVSKSKNKILLSHSWNAKQALQERIQNILGGKRSRRNKAFKVVAISAIGLTLAITYTLSSINNAYLEDLVLEKAQQQYAQQINGKEKVIYSQIPEHFISALLVQEDRAFFAHDGVDSSAILAASLAFAQNKLLNSNTRVRGGSTITMQLAKNLVIENFDRSVSNKLRQVKVAKILEEKFSKEEIIEMYLTTCFFGNNTWGLVDASKMYVKKTYQSLTLEESALLVPIIQLPRLVNPVADADIARQRQQSLLENINQYAATISPH